MRFQDLLLVPDRFFQEQDSEKLVIPLIIIGMIGIISAVSAYFVTTVTIQALVTAMPAGSQQYLGIAILFAIIGGILGAYLLWVVASVIFFGLSAVFHGSGSFKKTLVNIGYGFVPQIIGGAISTYYMYQFASSVRIPRITDPNLINQVMKELMADPNFVLGSAVGILFMLWSANIWIFGLKHARNLSTRDAAICVLAPVGIYLIYTLYTLGIFRGIFS
ncbi:MAG: YIP1 family protein [Methanomicrobiales archaeon]|nr:YIP1 family protein [Methanomicrobiales archaeon]